MYVRGGRGTSTIYSCIWWQSCLEMLIYATGFQHVGSWDASFQLAAWFLFATRTAQHFQPWKSMDKCAMPSRLVELEQLHVELISVCSTSLHCSSAQCRPWKAEWDLETRLEYGRAEPSGLAVLDELHVESNSSVVDIKLTLYTHKHVARPHLRMWHARHDMVTYSWY